jgi:Icc-related predicted phosphoesterase
MRCVFVSDLHGREIRYERLFKLIRRERPVGVLLGGDLFPRHTDITSFMEQHLFRRLRDMSERPEVFVIMGNDDRRDHEHLFLDADNEGILHYVNLRKVRFGDMFVRGYSFVPPSPFRLKDWEKRDIPGEIPYMTIPPEEGITTVDIGRDRLINDNIREDMEVILGDPDLPRTIFLCHAPPHDTVLDKVGYEAPGFDPHVGSRSIRDFIERAHPIISLHGHIHESTTVTGAWKDTVGSTLCFNAATEAEGLCVVRFDPSGPDISTRELL